MNRSISTLSGDGHAGLFGIAICSIIICRCFISRWHRSLDCSANAQPSFMRCGSFCCRCTSSRRGALIQLAQHFFPGESVPGRVILAGLYTGYQLISLEFRTDNLWAPVWLLCLTVLVTGPLTVRRALVAG